MRDDAAVYQLTPDRAIVATVDFFTPIVDDAYDFGRIAAANAFSDVYAMGGVHPKRIVTLARARAGDALVLTKPIGTGILSTALKRDLATAAEIAPAVQSMTTLNAGAARAMRATGGGVHAATDVTGFGLLGHLHNMLAASGVSAEIDAAAVPLLPNAAELVARGAIPGGTERNREALAPPVTFEPGVAEAMRVLLFDAQTSGGLLIAVDPDRANTLLAALQREGTPAAARIGRLARGVPGAIAEIGRAHV